jgi:hypothetical protein
VRRLNWTFTGTISRQSPLLRVAFKLQGDLKAIELPPLAKHPVRRHRLWENTCLECFLTPAGSSAYWEFNLSPSVTGMFIVLTITVRGCARRRRSGI